MYNYNNYFQVKNKYNFKTFHRILFFQIFFFKKKKYLLYWQLCSWYTTNILRFSLSEKRYLCTITPNIITVFFIPCRTSFLFPNRVLQRTLFREPFFFFSDGYFFLFIRIYQWPGRRKSNYLKPATTELERFASQLARYEELQYIRVQPYTAAAV